MARGIERSGEEFKRLEQNQEEITVLLLFDLYNCYGVNPQFLLEGKREILLPLPPSPHEEEEDQEERYIHHFPRQEVLALISQKLPKFRLSLGILEKDFAQTIGISEVDYIKIEQGLDYAPLSLFYELCQSYGLNSLYLFGKKESMFAKNE